MSFTRTSPGRLLAALPMALLAVVLLAFPAAAQYPVAPDNGLSCTPENPTPGATVTCVSGGYEPGSTASYQILCGGTVVATNTTTADADGNISYTYVQPGSSAVGTSCGSVLSGTLANGSPVTATDTFTVSAPGGTGGTDGEGLPVTGSDSTNMALIAGGAVILGGALLLAARRRQTVDA